MAQDLTTPGRSPFNVPPIPQPLRGKPARKPVITGPQVTAIFFLIPALVIFIIFVVWPITQSAHYSLLNWDGVQTPTAAGLANYTKLVSLDIETFDASVTDPSTALRPGYTQMFHVANIVVGATDPIFWRAIGNNVLVVIWSLLTQIPLAIGLAILLTGKLKASAFFRTLYFAPLVLSDVLVASVWNWIYNAPIGMLNSFLKSIHLQPLGWLGDPNLAMFCILVVSTWRFLGFYIVIYIAAIQGISEELYEVARIDGANSWQLHRFITIPLLMPTTRINAVLIMIGSLKFFDLVWVMSQGGPSHSSEVLATYMFKEAFQTRDWGYASTIAMALFMLAFVIAIIFLISTRRQAKVT